MKVTVKGAQHEKAMNPDIWPLRVGVRHFRAPFHKPASNGTSWASQSSQSGGKEKTQGGNRNHQHKKHQAGNKRESTAPGISVQNKFEILGTLMELINHP